MTYIPLDKRPAPPLLPDPEPPLHTHRPVHRVEFTTLSIPPVTHVIYTNRPITSAHIKKEHTTMSEFATRTAEVRESDVDQRHIEGLAEAQSLLGRYVDIQLLTPIHQPVTLDQLVDAKLASRPRRAGMQPSRLERKNTMKQIRKILVKLATEEPYRFDRNSVALDTQGHHWTRARNGDQYNESWLSQDAPRIVFSRIDEELTPTLCNLLPGMDGIAMLFNPALAVTPEGSQDLRRVVRRGGEIVYVPNQYNPEGYIAIIAAFPTWDDTEAAAYQRSRAVDTVSMSGEGTAWLPDAEAQAMDDDEAAALADYLNTI